MERHDLKEIEVKEDEWCKGMTWSRVGWNNHMQRWDEEVSRSVSHSSSSAAS